MASAFLPEDLVVRILGALVTNIIESGGHCSSLTEELNQAHACRLGCKILAAVSQSSRRCRDAIVAAGLWQRSVQVVLWPMSAPKTTNMGAPEITNIDAHASQIRLLNVLGFATRRLHINCMQLPSSLDLAWLTDCCPSVQTLMLSFYGPEGTFTLDWVNCWRCTLTHLHVHFWYDDCLGAPPVTPLLSSVFRTSHALEEIHLRGVDWPRARIEIYCAFLVKLPCSSLRRLTLEGSEPWSAAELTGLRSKGIVVDLRLVADRGR